MELSYLDRYPDVPVTLGEQLDRCAELFPDRKAVIDTNSIFTWSQLRRQVNIVAAELKDLDVQPGDRVMVGMERRFDIVTAYLAIARIGAVAVPANFRSSKVEQKETIDLVRPVGVILHTDLEETLSELETGSWKIVIDSPQWRQKIENVSIDPSVDKTGHWDAIKPDNLVYLNMTSGSTGKPKAAKATHRNLFANTKACVEKFNLNEVDVHLPLFAVMSHPHEIFCRALFTGGAIVLIEKLYPRTIAEMVDAHKVSCIMAVSAVYKLMIPFMANGKYDFSSMKLPESGGMPTPESVIQQFKEHANVPVIPVWGSTETMGVAFASELNGSTPVGSVGKNLSGYHVRIVDRDENVLGHGEVGELYLKGAGVTAGYWQDEATTNDTFSEEWYRTGDLFECDKEGNFYFRGRMDAMIKAGGVKIYPAEIEAVLFAHPAIREAVVVPFDDRLRGLVPMAVIVTEPGESLTEAQIRSFLKSRLSSQKSPRVFRFLPDLPRTASGKIDRKSLLSFSGIEDSPTEVSLERRLDAIDLKILHLLNERMRIEIELMDVKDDAGFQPEKMQETIQRILEFNPGPIHDSIIEQVFRSILSLRTLYQG